MNFSICRIAGRAVAFAAVATLLAAKPLPIVAAPASPARFPTANGTVKYRMIMSGAGSMNNNITMTWASYGARFRQDTQIRMNVMGRQMNINSWSVYDGKALYNELPSGMFGRPANRKIAMRMTLPQNYLNRMATGNSPTGTGAGRIVGHGTILGKPCEIRVISLNDALYKGQAKIWRWQKLPLRSEVSTNIKIGGATQKMKMSMVATQLNTNVKPSPALFRLPAGYKVQEMGGKVQEMGGFQKQMQGRMQGRSPRR